VKTYLVSDEFLKKVLRVIDYGEEDMSDEVRATIIAMPAAEPVAWMHPNEGLSYENHYAGNVPLYTQRMRDD
jgi:hypothetical protein